MLAPISALQLSRLRFGAVAAHTTACAIVNVGYLLHTFASITRRG